MVILYYRRFRVFDQSYKFLRYNLHKLKTTSAPAVTATATAKTNRHSTPETSVNSEPSNKKLRLLENLYSDDDHDDAGDCQCWWHDKTSFRIFQEVAAYLGPTVLTEEEKCRLCFSGKVTVMHIPISFKFQKCINFELVIGARRKHVFGDWFCKELSFFYCASSSQ